MGTETLLILTGDSGAGKDSLFPRLQEHDPHLVRVITHTSRPMRIGEVQHRDYHFVDRLQFESMLAADVFFEHVNYAGDYKGTTKSSLLAPLNEGKDVLWRIDPTRAATIAETITQRFDPEDALALLQRTLVIYLTGPNIKSLGLRQLSRGDSIDTVIPRLITDHRFFRKNKQHFKHVVVNEDGHQELTLAEIMSLIASGEREA